MNWLEDDGLVFRDGELHLPQIIQDSSARKFKGCDSLVGTSLIKRYTKCYPFSDNTTPSFSEFKSLGGGKKKK